MKKLLSLILFINLINKVFSSVEHDKPPFNEQEWYKPSETIIKSVMETTKPDVVLLSGGGIRATVGSLALLSSINTLIKDTDIWTLSGSSWIICSMVDDKSKNPFLENFNQLSRKTFIQDMDIKGEDFDKWSWNVKTQIMSNCDNLSKEYYKNLPKGYGVVFDVWPKITGSKKTARESRCQVLATHDKIQAFCPNKELDLSSQDFRQNNHYDRKPTITDLLALSSSAYIAVRYKTKGLALPLFQNLKMNIKGEKYLLGDSGIVENIPFTAFLRSNKKTAVAFDYSRGTPAINTLLLKSRGDLWHCESVGKLESKNVNIVNFVVCKEKGKNTVKRITYFYFNVFNLETKKIMTDLERDTMFPTQHGLIAAYNYGRLELSNLFEGYTHYLSLLSKLKPEMYDFKQEDYGLAMEKIRRIDDQKQIEFMNAMLGQASMRRNSDKYNEKDLVKDSSPHDNLKELNN